MFHETTAVGCTCDLECVERDKSATPLDHAIGGAAIEFYSALGLSCVLLAMRVTQIHPLSLSASASSPALLPLCHIYLSPNLLMRSGGAKDATDKS